MSKIKILPEVLSNKIAAGEVVERPSSVVKELVENALDAKSSRIMIEVEKGGRSLIRVSDNGTGMNRDDALLAPERYATSKIHKDEDLFAINTLGFRGEALPSIAAVSKFCLVTRDETSQAGTEIIVEGGTLKKVSEIGAPRGTMITVKQLFFNMPARRKFLKTVNTEMGHIADAVSSLALGRPGVHFRLVHNDRRVKNWPATDDPVNRIVDVLGKDIKDDIFSIEFTGDSLSIAGWLSSPGVTRSTSRGIYVYVNGRYVRDRVIQHALFEGYHGRMVKGQYPVAVLFIRVPYEQVDVNVHPTKHEVRFAQQKMVHDTVAGVVRDRLRSSDRPGWTMKKSRPSAEYPGVAESATHFRIPQQHIKAQHPATNNQYPRSNGIFAPLRPASPLKQDFSFTPTGIQTPLWSKKRFSDLRVIGQFHDTYILCESAGELVLIDQHAAHERIFFERLKNRSLDSRTTAQKLLIPETFDLGYREGKILEKLIPDLNELGLEIEPFGGDTFVVKSVPALLKDRAVKPLVIEMVEKMAQIGFTPGLEKAIDACLMLMACHGAIRGNQRLSDKEIKGLLEQLDGCDQPSNCPHGRPVWIRMTLKDLEKLFKRIV
jgi:DNA mismatch repair protein MutL